MNFTVENDIQAVLFERFVKPELEKGLWKDTPPRNHAQPWLDTLVHVAPPLGRDFDVNKAAYNLLRLAQRADTNLAMRAAAYYAREQGRDAGMSLDIDLDNLKPEVLDTVFSTDQLKLELRALRRLMKTHASYQTPRNAENMASERRLERGSANPRQNYPLATDGQRNRGSRERLEDAVAQADKTTAQVYDAVAKVEELLGRAKAPDDLSEAEANVLAAPFGAVPQPQALGPVPDFMAPTPIGQIQSEEVAYATRDATDRRAVAQTPLEQLQAKHPVLDEFVTEHPYPAARTQTSVEPPTRVTHPKTGPLAGGAEDKFPVSPSAAGGAPVEFSREQLKVVYPDPEQTPLEQLQAKHPLPYMARSMSAAEREADREEDALAERTEAAEAAEEADTMPDEMAIEPPTTVTPKAVRFDV